MRILYFDCFSGISGDMTLGALIEAGADPEQISKELAKLNCEPFTLSWHKVVKTGIASTKVDIVTDAGQAPAHHRHYSDIKKMIKEAGLREKTEAYSLLIFDKIAAAESKIHQIEIGKVHFHEVGAIDSIADIVGTAAALDLLEIDRICASPVPLGSGTVKCQHGHYPVPAPATLEMMKGLPIAESRHAKELTTPTGAAIISAVVQDFCDAIPPMIIEAIGYGAGTIDLPDQPNVLRAVIGKAETWLQNWSSMSLTIEGSAPEMPHHHHQHRN